MLVLETESQIASADISSEYAAGEYTNSSGREMLVGSQIRVSSMNGAAANISAGLRLKSSGGTKIADYIFTQAKHAAADTAWGADADPILMKYNEKVEWRVLSSNGADSTVVIDVQWYRGPDVHGDTIPEIGKMIYGVGNVWYVDGTNGNNSNAGDLPGAGGALATIAEGVAAASNGDMIMIAAGSYAEDVDLNTGSDEITLIGAGRELTIITGAGGAGSALELYNNCTTKHLSVVPADATGKGIWTSEAAARKNITIEDVKVEAATDAIYDKNGTDGLRIINCWLKSDYDGVYIDGTNVRVYIRDSYIETDNAAVQHSAALSMVADSGILVVENSQIVATAASGDKKLMGVFASLSTTVLRNCKVSADSSSGTQSAEPVTGVRIGNTGTLLMDNTGITSSSTGDPDIWDIQATAAGSMAIAQNCDYDRTKIEEHTANTVVDGDIIDGLSIQNALTAIMAREVGKAVVSGTSPTFVVSYKKRDGVTEASTATYDAYGNRTVSTLP